MPIRAAARSRFPSNWELSTARATAAVRFLTENAGVDPRRLGAVGYGEFRPVADNATPEGRARNRRIAITILSEEMAGADVPPIRPRTNSALLGASSPADTQSASLRPQPCGSASPISNRAHAPLRFAQRSSVTPPAHLDTARGIVFTRLIFLALFAALLRQFPF